MPNLANYAPVINNFGYDTAISNGQNGSAVVSFAKDIVKPKNNQLAAITLLKDKVDINKKITKNDIVKVRLQYIVTFLITINFKSSKAVWLIEYRIKILKSLRNLQTN
jgi:hypothetical protein